MNKSGLKINGRIFRRDHVPANSSVRHVFSLLLVAVTILGLSACAGINLQGNPGQDVRQAAEDYWKARVAGDWITCYKYEEVSRSGKVRLSQYVQTQGNLIYKSARIEGVSMGDQGKKAVIKVAVEYYLPAFGTSNAFKSTLSDKWIKMDGKWYHHKNKRLAER